MKTINHKRLLGFLICTSLLTACGGSNINATPGNHTLQTKPMTSNPATLASMVWQLNSIHSSGGSTSKLLKAGDAASRYQVSIKDGQISVSGGCNIMSGSVTLGQGNSFSIGPMMETKRACMGTLMQSDSEISAYLRSVNSYSVDGQTLTLNTNDGQKLSFNGIQTAETKYGSKGVRKFIELTNSKQGIQWREVKYDSNWIRIKDNAPWQTNFPGIQGFTPEMNMEYIVRLDEFTDPNTKKAVWVKDMVTMSGILR